jgi:hypothetical protein
MSPRSICLTNLEDLRLLLAARILVTFSLAMLFFAYANFAPTALGSPEIADYVKNHFVREMIFGVALSALTIYLVCRPLEGKQWLLVAIFGSVVVLPFWVAALSGWATGGMQLAWRGAIEASSAYWLHGSQVALFYCGLLLLYLAIPKN